MQRHTTYNTRLKQYYKHWTKSGIAEIMQPHTTYNTTDEAVLEHRTTTGMLYMQQHTIKARLQT